MVNAAATVLVAALVLLSGCARPVETPETALQRVTQVLREGRSAEAVALARAAAERYDTAPDWPWRFHLIEAEGLLFQLQPKDAAALLGDSLPSALSTAALQPRYAYLKAYTQFLSGNPAGGLAMLPGIAAQARDAGLPDVALDAIVLQAQGLLRQGKFDEADRMLVDALASTDNNVAYQRGAVLLNLGMSRLVRSRFDEALAYFEQVLADRSIESTLVYRVALSNAGICYSRLGDLERAAAMQRRAADGHERAGLAPYLEQSLGELGVTLMLSGQASDGLASLTRALALATEKGQVADAALWAGNLAIAYGDLGDWSSSEQFNDEAIALKQKTGSTRLTYNIYNRARIAAGRGRIDEAIATYEEAIRGAADDSNAQWMAHEGLAQVYRAADRMADASRHFELALGLIEKTRVDLLTREYRLTFLSRLIRFHQSYVDALVANGDIERALEVAESSRARVLAERHAVASGARVPAKQFVQLAARSRSVLLSYWLAPARSFVWIITGNGIRVVTLPGSQQIEPLVRGYRDLVTMSLADPLAVESSPGTRLSEMVLRPVLDAIPQQAAVVIVPDGALHDLSFDMLPIAGPTPHYFIEDATVTLAPSLALAASAAKPAQAVRSLLLVGDPANADTTLPPLTYAGSELTGIQRAFAGDTQVLRGADATPQAVAASHPERFGFIHFAAHATASADSPLDSAILLSPNTPAATSPQLSASATSASNTRGLQATAPPGLQAAVPASTYKLYARDVTALPLTADVVTLSACRSAGGRAYGGEGLVGFAWAFLRAGARQVVAGLWDVDDQSTALLMERYYQRLGAGASAAAALRDAKLSLLHSSGNFRKPYYWAAFAVFASALDAS